MSVSVCMWWVELAWEVVVSPVTWLLGTKLGSLTTEPSLLPLNTGDLG